MAKIHNNPKLAESRMPVILPKAFEDEWLKPIGKESVGNVPESSDEFVYAVPIYGSS